jgi:ketosteroid isomerase-like protein
MSDLDAERPDTNAERARRGFEAVLRGDVDAIAPLLDPDVKWHCGDPSSGCHNSGEVLDFMRQALTRRRSLLRDNGCGRRDSNPQERKPTGT